MNQLLSVKSPLYYVFSTSVHGNRGNERIEGLLRSIFSLSCVFQSHITSGNVVNRDKT